MAEDTSENSLRISWLSALGYTNTFSHLINERLLNSDLLLKIAILAKIKDATDRQHSLSKGNWTESLSGDKRTESLSQDKRSYWVLNWVVFLFSTWSHYHYFSGWWSRSLEFKQTRRWLKRWLFIVYYFFICSEIFLLINLNFL